MYQNIYEEIWYSINNLSSNNDSASICVCLWKHTIYCRNKGYDETKIWSILIFPLFSLHEPIALSETLSAEILLKFYCSYFGFWMTPVSSSVPVPLSAHSFPESTSFYTHVTLNNYFSFKVFASLVLFLISFLFKVLTLEHPKFSTTISSLLLIVHAIVESFLIILVIYVFYIQLQFKKCLLPNQLINISCSILR